MKEWTEESLWQKAKLYLERALEVDRDGDLFPFWAILGLEFLARAVLAKVHPALLADPMNEGKNILYAFGFEKIITPRSIMAKAVFARCVLIVPEFTEQEENICKLLIKLRNEELHTGNIPFADFKTENWLADYFHVCEVLLRSLDKSLEDLLGKVEISAAQEMIKARDESLIAVAKEKISTAGKEFNALSEELKNKRQTKGEFLAAHALELSSLAKETTCPSCKSTSVLDGELVSTKEKFVEDIGVIEEKVVLPTLFNCHVCGLELNGHEQLHPAGLGGQFVITSPVNWEEFFEGPEYMNE